MNIFVNISKRRFFQEDINPLTVECGSGEGLDPALPSYCGLSLPGLTADEMTSYLLETVKIKDTISLI